MMSSGFTLPPREPESEAYRQSPDSASGAVGQQPLDPVQIGVGIPILGAHVSLQDDAIASDQQRLGKPKRLVQYILKLMLPPQALPLQAQQ